MVTGWILPYNLRPFLECLLALLDVPWHDLSWETTRANVALTDFDAEHWHDVEFTGMRAPMAAASGSGTRWTGRRPPACSAASRTARCSTLVTPAGIQTMISGLMTPKRPTTFWMK